MTGQMLLLNVSKQHRLKKIRFRPTRRPIITFQKLRRVDATLIFVCSPIQLPDLAAFCERLTGKRLF